SEPPLTTQSHSRLCPQSANHRDRLREKSRPANALVHPQPRVRRKLQRPRPNAEPSQLPAIRQLLLPKPKPAPAALSPQRSSTKETCAECVRRRAQLLCIRRPWPSKTAHPSPARA